jgi:hypothetical protein
MVFNRITYLKKGLVLFFICLLNTLPGIKGMNYENDSNRDFENPLTLKIGCCFENFISSPDTLIKLSSKEKSEGWELLFDGKNTDKWRSVNSDNFPANGWTVEHGTLFLSGENAGDIITKEKFGNFELVLDFKLTHSANSGIKYFVTDMTNKADGKIFKNGPEYQIIDDYNHPEIKDHQHEKSSTASLYLIYAPQNKKLKPEGEWNQVRIIAKGKYVEHWLNGIKVLSYERGTKEFRQLVSETKFKDQKDYGEVTSGHILLTDHHDKVYFKNIRIRRL